jgi:hypothetical protein
MDVTSTGDSENGAHWPHYGEPRMFRVEHRVAGQETVVLARIANVFPHHDTLTQYVSRLLNERGDDPLFGDLVLIEEETGAVLARRDLYRACLDARRGRSKPPKNGR